MSRRYQVIFTFEASSPDEAMRFINRKDFPGAQLEIRDLGPALPLWITFLLLPLLAVMLLIGGYRWWCQ